MTGDRKLSPHELKVFMQHHQIGWDTIKEMLFVGGEPSLFEVTFLEIFGKIDAIHGVIIDQGAKLDFLEKMMSAFKGFRAQMVDVKEDISFLEGKIKELLVVETKLQEDLKEVHRLLEEEE